jgi:hypothetical protein
MWDKLPEDVREELTDPRFTGRTHGKRGTYARASDGGKGCRGPLCRKAERDEGHTRYARRQEKKGAERPARVGLRDDQVRARDEELNTIQLWHEGQRELARLNRLVQPDLTPDDLERTA